MNKLSKLTRGFAALILVGAIALTACDGNAQSQVSVDESTEQVMSSKADELSSLISGGVTELENKEIIWLAWWKLEVGTPEVDAFVSMYGGTVKNRSTTWENRYTDLANQIISEDSPDIFPFEAGNFPSGVINNMYQPIDDYIDLDSDLWASSREMLDGYMWGDKHYVATAYIAPDSLLIYNKKTIDENGLDDPHELFLSGDWTWDKMLDMMKEFTSLDDTYNGINDYKVIVPSVVCTTGIPTIGIENGQLVNNLRSKEVERGQNFLLDISKDGLNISDGDHAADIGAGSLLFYVGQYWGDVKDTFSPTTKQNIAEDVWYVPFPRDPDADKYFQLYTVDAHVLVEGAPNPEGFAAWITCRRLVKIDEDLTRMDAEMCLNKFNLPLDSYYYFMELCQPEKFGITPIADYTSGAELGRKSTDALNYSAFRDGLTWAETREAYYAEVQAKVDELNAK
ncbi:MAG TPA: extracellular solute-binding protein [Oscillospiraceae bacterium]|nr:extracellular solute-binding protein [Oscillospiraceae bacterium]